MRDLRTHFSTPWALPLALVLASAAAGDAAAQERTTATYDDWVVQCVSVAGSPKACDMVQIAQVQGRNAPFSRVAIAHPERGKPLKLSVEVPPNVTALAEMHIQTSDSDPGLAAPFDRCLPAGCVAQFVIPDDELRRFRAAGKPGKITFKIANGRAIAIPLSFKGFDQAFDALATD